MRWFNRNIGPRRLGYQEPRRNKHQTLWALTHLTNMQGPSAKRRWELLFSGCTGEVTWETRVDRPSVGLSLTGPQEMEPSPMVAKETPEMLSGAMKKGEPPHQKKPWEERCWERMREME